MFQSVLVCVDVLSECLFCLSVFVWPSARCCECNRKRCKKADLFKSLKVVSEESHGLLGLCRAQLHDAVFQQLLDVVLLDIELAFAQAPLLFTVGCHADLSLFTPSDLGGKKDERLMQMEDDLAMKREYDAADVHNGRHTVHLYLTQL